MLRLEPYTQVATSSDGRWQFEVRFLGAERDFLSCYKLFDCRLGKRAYLQDSSSKLGLPDQAFVHPSGDAVVWFNGLCCNYAVSLDRLGTERLVVGVSSEAHGKRRGPPTSPTTRQRRTFSTSYLRVYLRECARGIVRRRAAQTRALLPYLLTD